MSLCAVFFLNLAVNRQWFHQVDVFHGSFLQFYFTVLFQFYSIKYFITSHSCKSSPSHHAYAIRPFIHSGFFFFLYRNFLFVLYFFYRTFQSCYENLLSPLLGSSCCSRLAPYFRLHFHCPVELWTVSPFPAHWAWFFSSEKNACYFLEFVYVSLDGLLPEHWEILCSCVRVFEMRIIICYENNN